jgi:F-type H+-transporting ATPase subunit alpha
LEHGQRVTELMKQKQFAPFSVSQMALVLYAANEGHLKDVPVNKVLEFEAALLSFAKSEISDTMAHIDATGDWSGELEGKFKDLIIKLKASRTW